MSYNFYMTVDTQVCYPFTLLTPWGYQTPELDTKFNSARALSITAIVLGGAAWFTLMLAACCKLDQGKMNGMSCYLWLAVLFQGLSLLMLRSNVCTPGFFTVYFTEPGTPAAETTPDWMEGVSCGLSTGSNCAIAATVLWFVCMQMLPLSKVPEPMWQGPEQATMLNELKFPDEGQKGDEEAAVANEGGDGDGVGVEQAQE